MRGIVMGKAIMDTKAILQFGAVLAIAFAGNVPNIATAQLSSSEKLQLIREAVRDGQILVGPSTQLGAGSVLLAQNWGNGFNQQPSCSPANKC